MKFIRMVFLVFCFSFITYLLNIEIMIKDHNYILSLDEVGMYNYKDIIIKEKKNDNNNYLALESFYGTITGYGPDCDGCIGITASGYDVRDTIYYNDREFGLIRIIAADKGYPFGTIIKLSNIDGYNDMITIVLDRGSAIGNNKRSQADILFASEDLSYDFGRIYDVKFEVLRYGY